MERPKPVFQELIYELMLVVAESLNVSSYHSNMDIKLQTEIGEMNSL